MTVPARADWEPPKDNVMTDKQVTAYLQVLSRRRTTSGPRGTRPWNAQTDAQTARDAAKDAREKHDEARKARD